MISVSPLLLVKNNKLYSYFMKWTHSDNQIHKQAAFSRTQNRVHERPERTNKRHEACGRSELCEKRRTSGRANGPVHPALIPYDLHPKCHVRACLVCAAIPPARCFFVVHVSLFKPASRRYSAMVNECTYFVVSIAISASSRA